MSDRSSTGREPRSSEAAELPPDMADELPGSQSMTGPGGVVTLEVPAEASYVSLVRTTTAALAARADFTLDEIDDARVAIDEACTLLLAGAGPGARMRYEGAPGSDDLRAAVSIRPSGGEPPQRSSFAWTVLTALASDVEVESTADGVVTITVHCVRHPRP
ncbi:MAG: hypothetical protein ACR2JQ_06180 [Mycobacteriales bacterium]